MRVLSAHAEGEPAGGRRRLCNERLRRAHIPNAQLAIAAARKHDSTQRRGECAARREGDVGDALGGCVRLGGAEPANGAVGRRAAEVEDVQLVRVRVRAHELVTRVWAPARGARALARRDAQ